MVQLQSRIPWKLIDRSLCSPPYTFLPCRKKDQYIFIDMYMEQYLLWTFILVINKPFDLFESTCVKSRECNIWMCVCSIMKFHLLYVGIINSLLSIRTQMVILVLLDRTQYIVWLIDCFCPTQNKFHSYGKVTKII